MPGIRGTRPEATEQLVPKGDKDEVSSSSGFHTLPQYDLPLPGTIPSVHTNLDSTTDSLSAKPGGNGDSSYRDMSTTAYLRAPGQPIADGEPGFGAGVAPQPSAAVLTSPSSRPGDGTAATSNGGSSIIAAMEIQEALLPPQPAPAFEHPIPLRERRWMVSMFCLVAALLFADQNLLAPNLTEAADFFGFDERQKDVWLGGVLMAAFFVVGAPAALLVGWLTDRGNINRRTLLFWVVVVGETPCLLTYWVTAYWQFFLLRALTGIAVGGCFPLVFSLLGDLFPPKRRAAVSAVVQIATALGILVGQLLSGSIGPATNWRVPFVVVAAPSLAVAVLMLLTTKEPPRGAFEEALRERFAEGLGAYEGTISWSKVRVLLRCPSNVLIILQGLPGSMPWGMVLTYFNDFLSQQKGFTVQTATLVLLMFSGGGGLGVIGGGAGGQWLYNRCKEYQALLAGGCVLAGIGPMYALVNADLQKIGLAATCFLAALTGLVASVAGPNLRSVMLNVNEPETRGVALALQSMTDDLGKGLGPALVAALISAMGREDAFNVATAGWIPCGIMLMSLACFMRRDEAAMQTRLAKSSEQQAAAAAAARCGDDSCIGVTVPMPPMSPSSEGGATSGPAATAAAAGAQAAAAMTPFDVRREERRLARVRLLADTASSDSMATARFTFGSSGGEGADDSGSGSGRAGRVEVAGGGGGSGSNHAHTNVVGASLPLSSSAPEVDPDVAGAGPGGRGYRGWAVGTFNSNPIDSLPASARPMYGFARPYDGQEEVRELPVPGPAGTSVGAARGTGPAGSTALPSAPSAASSSSYVPPRVEEAPVVGHTGNPGPAAAGGGWGNGQHTGSPGEPSSGRQDGQRPTQRQPPGLTWPEPLPPPEEQQLYQQQHHHHLQYQHGQGPGPMAGGVGRSSNAAGPLATAVPGPVPVQAPGIPPVPSGLEVGLASGPPGPSPWGSGATAAGPSHGSHVPEQGQGPPGARGPSGPGPGGLGAGV